VISDSCLLCSSSSSFFFLLSSSSTTSTTSTTTTEAVAPPPPGLKAQSKPGPPMGKCIMLGLKFERFARRRRNS
jgi:hypothetical protein